MPDWYFDDKNDIVRSTDILGCWCENNGGLQLTWIKEYKATDSIILNIA